MTDKHDDKPRITAEDLAAMGFDAVDVDRFSAWGDQYAQFLTSDQVAHLKACHKLRMKPH